MNDPSPSSAPVPLDYATPGLQPRTHPIMGVISAMAALLLGLFGLGVLLVVASGITQIAFVPRSPSEYGYLLLFLAAGFSISVGCLLGSYRRVRHAIRLIMVPEVRGQSRADAGPYLIRRPRRTASPDTRCRR